MKSKTIQLRVTPEQHARIKNKAYAKGYTSMTSFLLHLALEKDLVFEQRFDEIYRAVMKISFNQSQQTQKKS